MAGGVSRTFAVIFLIVGLVLLVGGAAAAVYGYTQYEDENERILQDQDKTEQAAAIGAIGAGAAGVGLLLIILAIVLFLVAGARSRRAIERFVQEQAAGVYKDPDAKAIPGNTGGAKARFNGLWISTAVVLVLVVLIWSLNLDVRSPNLFGPGPGSNDDQPKALDVQSWPGRLNAGAAQSECHAFTMAPTANRYQAALSWSQEFGGTDELRLIVFLGECSAGNQLKVAEGKTPVEVDVTEATAGKDFEGAAVHVRIQTADGSPVVGQGFAVKLSPWKMP